jgi:ketosteroid isomerase-like protein
MPETTSDIGSVRQALDAKNRAFEQAANAGDLARAARGVYTKNARILPPDAPMIEGRDAIAEFWTKAAAQLGVKQVRLETVELDAHSGHAHEIGRATLTLASGETVVGKYVVLWKQEDGEWRWDVDIWNT